MTAATKVLTDTPLSLANKVDQMASRLEWPRWADHGGARLDRLPARSVTD